MVPRWEADCILLPTPGKTKHIYIVSADGGAPKEVTKGERDRLLSQLVAGWQFVVFWQRHGRDRHLSAEFEDQPTHDLARF